MNIAEYNISDMTVTELLDVFGNMDNVHQAVAWYQYQE